MKSAPRLHAPKTVAPKVVSRKTLGGGSEFPQRTMPKGGTVGGGGSKRLKAKVKAGSSNQS